MREKKDSQMTFNNTPFSPRVFFQINMMGRVVEVSREGLNLFGYSQADIEAGLYVDSLVPPEEKEHFKQSLAALFRGESLYGSQYFFNTRGGQKIPVFIHAEAITNEKGVTGVRGILFDLSGNEQIAQALEQERRLSQEYLNMAGNLLLRLDTYGRVMMINRAGCNILECEPDDIVMRDWIDTCVPQEFRIDLRSAFDLLIHTSNEKQFFHRIHDIVTFQNNRRTVSWTYSLLKSNNGVSTSILCAGEDITDRINMENELRSKEEKYHAIFMEARAGIVLVDVETGEIADCNPGFERITGRLSSQLIGKKFWETIPEEDRNTVRTEFSNLPSLARGISKEGKHITPDGEIIPVEYYSKTVKISGKLYIQSITHDISRRKIAEQLHRESEEKFSRAFHASPDFMSIIDENQRFVEVNESFIRGTGFSREEIVGQTPDDLRRWIYPDEKQRVGELLKKDSRVTDQEFHMRKKDGSIQVMLMTIEQISIGGRPHSLSISRDITERKKTEEALRESEERFNRAFHGNPDMVCISTMEDGTIIDVNDKLLEASGLKRDQIVGHSIADFKKSLRLEPDIDIIETLLTEGHIENLESVSSYPDGQPMWFSLSASLIDIDGEHCILTSIRDITNQEKIKQALKESEEKFSKAFHSSPDAITITDAATGVILEVNDSACELTGYSREEMLGKSVLDLGLYTSEESRQWIEDTMQREGHIVRAELDFRHRSGEIRTMLYTLENIVLNGHPCLLSVKTEITEIKRVEKALRESEHKFARVFHTSPNAMALMSEDKTYIEVNETFANSIGVDRNKIIGKKPTDIFNPNALVVFDKVDAIFNASGRVVSEECDFVSNDGARRTALFWMERVNISGSICVLTISLDITERKRIQQALQESDARFSAAFHSSPNLMLITGIDENLIIEVNDRYCEITGYSREELIGHHVEEFPMWVDMAEKQSFVEELTAKGNIRNHEYRQRMKSGVIRTWLCSATTITIRGQHACLNVATDITERQQVEAQIKFMYEQEASLRQQLEEEIKRRAEFTRALVHELKTPLTPIIASSEGLASVIADEPMLSMARNVNRGANNLNKRIDELLELARSELNILQIDPVPIDIAPLLRDIESEMKLMASNRHQSLTINTPAKLPTVNADAGRIRQVVENLLTNAFKFTPDGGKILLYAMEDNGSVIVEVRDSGPGLSRDEMTWIFQNYHRKVRDREHLSGLGIGLSLCKTFIDMHGGQIWVNSEPGKGSVFSFSLPVIEK